MSDLSKAQKVRLGFFLLIATAIVAAVVIYKVGGTVFSHSDKYFVRISGGVGGLTAGSDVTYNGIVIGKVNTVAVDPVDVAMVRLGLELQEGTPIPENTTATVVLQGITGTRRVDLMGGTNGVRRRLPGEEIPAGVGLFDELLQKAENISAKIDTIADQVNRITSEDNLLRIEGTLANIERISAGLAGTIEDTRPRIGRLLDVAETASGEVSGALNDVRSTIKSLNDVVDHTDGILIREVGPLLSKANSVVARVDGAVAKVDGFVANASTFVGRFDTAVGRTQSDVQRVLVELSDGIDSIAQLAEMLRRDPSSLIQGKTWAGRDP